MLLLWLLQDYFRIIYHISLWHCEGGAADQFTGARAGRLTSALVAVAYCRRRSGKDMLYQPALTKDISLNNLLKD